LAWARVVLGEHATTTQCAALAGVEAPAAAAADLVAAGVLADDDGRRFRHPLIAAAVGAGMPTAERARWHGRAARMLQAAGADAERVAVHLTATEPAGTADVV